MFRTLLLAAAAAIGLTGGASAATLATFDIDGTYEFYGAPADLRPAFMSLYVDGSFDGELLDPNILTYDAYEFSASVSANGSEIASGAFTATATEIVDALTAISSSPIAGDITDLITYMVSNTGDVYPTPFGNLTFSYSNIVAGGSTVTGDFNLGFDTEYFSPEVASFFTQPTGTFEINLAVASVDPVPLPAGLPLLLAGLGGFALVRRRKAPA